MMSSSSPEYNHLDYCTSVGHGDTRSGMCYDHKLAATQCEFVLKAILDEAVQDGAADVTYTKYIEFWINCSKCCYWGVCVCCAEWRD